jgi:hypothetical protein
LPQCSLDQLFLDASQECIELNCLRLDCRMGDGVGGQVNPIGQIGGQDLRSRRPRARFAHYLRQFSNILGPFIRNQLVQACGANPASCRFPRR